MKSIIVPVYNSEKTVRKVLDSLLKQTYNEDEVQIIVVDDGSTDQTVKYASEFNIEVVRQEHNGPAHARNLGAEKAKGDIILFTDADCVPQTNWLKAMLKPFEDEKVVGVMGKYITFQDNITARFAQAEFEERYNRYAKILNIDIIATYSAAFRREVFISERGFNESFPKADNEDVEFSYRLSLKGYQLRFSPNAIVAHHHPDKIWKYFRQKFNRATWRMVVYSYHPQKAVKDTYTPQSLKLQIILSMFFFLGVVISFFSFLGFYLSFGAIIIFILTSLTFVFNHIKSDRLLALAAPFYLFVRASAFNLGIFRAAFYLLKR